MLAHKGTQTIYTERLVLRRFTVDDAQAMYDNWANDERVSRFLSWSPHKSSEETKQLLDGWCDAYKNRSVHILSPILFQMTFGAKQHIFTARCLIT